MPQMMPVNWVLILIVNFILLCMVMVSVNSMNISMNTKLAPSKSAGKGANLLIEWK